MAEGRAPEPRQAHAQIFYGCLKTIKKSKIRYKALYFIFPVLNVVNMAMNDFFDVKISLTTLCSVVATCVPIFVSFAAYYAAKTQRDISANQYKLDLYLKKREIFDKLVGWKNKNNNKTPNLHELIKIKEIIRDMSIFSSIDFSSIKSEIDNLINLLNKANKIANKIPDDSAESRDLEIDVVCIWLDINQKIENFCDVIGNSLAVPQNPY